MSRSGKAILIVSAGLTLGAGLAAECARRNIEHCIIADAGEIDRLLRELDPWAVINATDWPDIDSAENDTLGCFTANFSRSLRLARSCARHSIPYVTFSTDLVFDGKSRRPYVETDAVAPLSVYGRSKARADKALLEKLTSALVIRSGAIFSGRDDNNFAKQVVDALRAGYEFYAADCVTSPTFVDDLVKVALDLTIDGAIGLWHLSNQGSLSWADFGREIAVALGLPARLIVETPLAQMPWPARRPSFSSLSTSRGQILPTLEKAIAVFASSHGT